MQIQTSGKVPLPLWTHQSYGVSSREELLGRSTAMSSRNEETKLRNPPPLTLLRTGSRTWGAWRDYHWRGPRPAAGPWRHSADRSFSAQLQPGTPAEPDKWPEAAHHMHSTSISPAGLLSNSHLHTLVTSFLHKLCKQRRFTRTRLPMVTLWPIWDKNGFRLQQPFCEILPLSTNVSLLSFTRLSHLGGDDFPK